MDGTDRNGTLDFPAGDGRRESEYGAIPSDSVSSSNPTFIVRKEQNTGGRPENTCLKCGAMYKPGEAFCRSCGATLSGRAIVDMRHTLGGQPGGSRRSSGVEVQKMKTSYRSGVMGARREMEGISPVPMPDFSQLQQQGSREGRKDSKYNVWLAASIIAFIVIMIVVLILLIAAYL